MKEKQDENLREARELLVAALGRQSSFWGLGKITGELYAVLYLSERPLTLGELAEALGVTKGNVSMAIRVLEQLGMVRRSMRPGDRRVYFEAELDFWYIARRVLEQRQKPEFNESFRMLEEGLEQALAAEPGPGRDFVLERLVRLQGFYRELDQVVQRVLSVGPEKIFRLLKVVFRV
uniref:HTH-type transcriptional regulator n=1 Tax=Ammonifex degensii TaxID=42838 RepID=A0A7C2HZM2_9THEO